MTAGLVVSGCSDSTGKATTSAADPQVVSAAKTQTAKYTAAQPDLVVPALKSRPPAGKKIAIITCLFPTCQAVTNAAADAAKKLGWTVESYSTEITPEAFQAVFTRMLQSPPDLLLYAGVLPNSIIASKLATVKSLNIPTVALATTDAPGDTMRAVLNGPPTIKQSGELMGGAVVADANGAAQTVFVWDPNQAVVFQPVKDAFTKQVEAAAGSVNVLNVAAQDTGKAIPGQVVSYLQAHPDVKYVAFDTADFVAGVPPALKAAGISNVKLLSRLPVASNVKNLKNGDEWVEVAEELSGSGYRAIDTLARLLEGSDFHTSPVGWHQILTKDNVSGIVGDPTPPGFPQVFLTAWSVG